MEGLAIVRAIMFRLFTYHPGVIGARSRLRSSDAESRLYGQCCGRKTTIKASTQARRREEWYGSWPSEDEPGVEGGEAHVCRARRAVGACERHLDERL
jgi:hypothetical protein